MADMKYEPGQDVEIELAISGDRMMHAAILADLRERVQRIENALREYDSTLNDQLT